MNYYVNCLIQNEGGNVWRCSSTNACHSIEGAYKVVHAYREGFRVVSAWIDDGNGNILWVAAYPEDGQVVECLRDGVLPAEKNRYELTEVCPYCESEVTVAWNVETMGYRAFCPVCGKRLMLCDACRHGGPDGAYTGRCDYDRSTDSCRHNPPCGNRRNMTEEKGE